MVRYVEATFRRRRLAAAVFLLTIAIGCTAGFLQPRTYLASSRLWFEKPAVGDSTGLNAYVTPADQAVGVFKELIDTRNFCVSVGQRGPLAAYLDEPGHLPGTNLFNTAVLQVLPQRAATATTTHAVLVEDAVQDTLQRKVVVKSVGPEVVTVTFDFTDARVAGATLRALIDQFSEDILSLRRSQAQTQVRIFDDQSQSLQANITTADAAVGTYLAAHPEQRVANPPPDATLASLQQTDKLAHDRYAALVQQLDQARLLLAGNAGPDAVGFRVLDDPETPHLPSSLSKVLLLYGGAGLVAGILLVAFLAALLVAVDNTIRRPSDLLRVTDARVIGVIPQL